LSRLFRQIALGASLLALSVFFYFFHYLIFRDAHHIFIYLVGDVAFVFIEVLLVTLIIHRLLEERARKTRLEKLNMVIGAFFSEVGASLLCFLSNLDPKAEQRRQQFCGRSESSGREFGTVVQFLQTHDYNVDTQKVEWHVLRDLLVKKRDFMLRLLENPNLIEHEAFTDLLRAVFHLTEELEFRTCFDSLPGSDYQHLGGDIRRVYGGLALQWVAYMEHLKNNYPYLFSLAVRTNPLDPNRSPIVKE